MKTVRFSFILVLGLLMVGCSVEGETATSVPTRVVVIATAVPPTPTPTQLPATETPVVMSTAVLPTNTATSSPATAVPTETPTITPTPLPPPTGKIYFFWDPTTFNGGVPPAAPKHNLFLATPGETASEWRIETLLDKVLDWATEAPSFPQVVLLPGQTKFVLTTWKDINDDGDVEDVSSIQIYDLEKNSLTRVTEYDPLGFALTWFPDSQRIVYAWGKEVYSVGVDGSPPQPMTPSFSQNVGSILTSPSGDFIAIWVWSGNLYLLDTDSGQIVTLLSDDEASRFVNMFWNPTGEWFAFSSGDRGPISVIDTNTLNIQSIGQPGLTLPAWSPTGSLLAVKQQVNDRTDLFIWDTEIQTTYPLANWESVQSSDHVWSPDGRYISLGVNFQNKARLYVIDVMTGEEKWIEWDQVSAGFPSWSPDGDHIAIGLNNGEEGALSMVSLETENLEEVFSIGDEKIAGLFLSYPHVWSPDGEWLLLSGISENRNSLYVVNKDVPEVSLVLEVPTNSLGPTNFFWLTE